MDLDYAREVLRTEADAISSLIPRVDDAFARAVRSVLDCRGHVIVTGMGKAGIVGQKISATLASTGTPSHFLHPAEAYHGDLGRVMKQDIVLALSNSGETEEVARLLPKLREIGAAIIAVTADRSSSLGKVSDIVLELGSIEEACPLGLAPSASTTAMLALGDALALSVLKERGLDKEDYARFHPGGELGRRLAKVRDVMRAGDRNPVVTENTAVSEALGRITAARAGAVSVVDGHGKFAGIFTDGDLRRLLARNPAGISEKIGAVMTRKATTIEPDRLVGEALRILRERKIDELPVVNERGEIVGMLDIQDVLGIGVS
ncbi:MAG: KpsF/GutQ family sugar-phosphate isomerase [Planctomycetes bacterium]|nr:KpsF/GutQ family sugar-phosphate isomerase [Planctomycetota bacterium]